MGYKSWEKLAEETYYAVKAQAPGLDVDSYKRYLSRCQYPELFRQAEVDVGGRDKLLPLVRSLLYPTSRRSGVIYEFLSQWPFACCLTTNYDDEISLHLESIGVHFGTVRNRPEDFHPIRDGAANYILKLHSDLDHPNDVVLTSKDYQRLETEPAGEYYREKLRMIFQMFDVVIVGHSLHDPDINLILKLAKNNADRTRPLYMVAADFTKAEEREFSEKYNIELVSYRNADGSHSELRRLLASTDKWIISRKSRVELPQFSRPPESEIEYASALYLFRKLKTIRSQEYLAPLILSILADAPGDGMGLVEITASSHIRGREQPDSQFENSTLEQLGKMLADGLVKAKGDKYVITPEGSGKVSEVRYIRKSETEQAFGQFAVDLRRSHPKLTAQEEETCKELAQTAILQTFSKRGLTIANKIFAKQSASAGELSDVFEIVSSIAAGLPSSDLAAAFVEAMHQLPVNPNAPQKNYLASLSQGYFLFHLLGLDPNLTQLRLEVLQHTLWLCDSSILLPLVAANCYNHEYARELFRLLKAADANVFTTTKLLDEAWEHFYWAVEFVKEHGVDSPEFLRAALVKGSFKQNLFIDGYISSAADGLVGTFGDYLALLSLTGMDRKSFENIFANYDIQSLRPNQVTGYALEDSAEMEETKSTIEKARKARGTFHSSQQIEAEAEVWLLLSHLKSGKYTLSDASIKLDDMYFISQSRLLDIAFPATKVVTWTPEAVYRYLAALPNAHMDPDLLQQCMTSEYFYAGISFIDEKRYLRFFGPSVEQAKISFEKEKTEYKKQVEQDSRGLDEITKEFDQLPDLEKPFVMSQMGWRLAAASKKREESAVKRAFEAEQTVKLLTSPKLSRKMQKDAKRQELARIRHLRDPRHAAKRRKQAEKRNKKHGR
jgi:hypothetical protein